MITLAAIKLVPIAYHTIIAFAEGALVFLAEISEIIGISGVGSFNWLHAI